MNVPIFAMTPVSRFGLGGGPLAAVFGALMLSGCASFSPDGGMSIVTAIADQTIGKDVVSIRTQED